MRGSTYGQRNPLPHAYRLVDLLENIHSLGSALPALIALVGFAFSLWMAYDCWKRNGDGYWIWLILCSGGIFALIYFFTQYWQGSSLEYGLWKRLTMMGRIREMEANAKRLNTAASYELLGDAYMHVARHVDAEVAYRESLKRQANVFDVQVRLGYALLALGRAEEAWPLLGKAYQQTPGYDSDNLVRRLARCQALRGNFQDARNLYEYFLRKHSYSEVQIEYAQVLVQMGQREEGRAKLEELIADIDYSPRYARSRERRWKSAAKRLFRAVDQAPG